MGHIEDNSPDPPQEEEGENQPAETEESPEDVPEPSSVEVEEEDGQKAMPERIVENVEPEEQIDENYNNELCEEDSAEMALKNYMLPPDADPDALDILKNMNFKMWSVDSMESIPEIEEIAEEVPEEVSAVIDEIDEAEELLEQPSEVEVIEDAEVVDDEEKGEEEESDISIKSGDLVYVKEEKVVVQEVKEIVAEEDPMVKFLELCSNYGINQFLTDVIDKVVDTCEYIDEDEILRGKLDLNKLLKCLYEKYTLLQIQQRKRFLLNKKVADYFRRKKNLRAITDDPPDHFMNEIRRYRDSLQILDELKNKEAKTIALVEEKTGKLTANLEELKNTLQDKIDNLNIHIREIGITTHYKKNSQLINEKLVDYFIRKMNSMRKEISKVRLHIIQQQHTIGVLQDKSKRLEELGNGLKMVEYEQLQTETIALTEKIEERNNELSRLRLRCNADTHIIAHIKEKQEMLEHKITLEQNVLDNLIDEQGACRAYVHGLKLQRDNLRKQYNELSYQCGLLDKPQLLHDYDATENEIQIVQEDITALKSEKVLLIKKIEKYEGLIHRS